MARRYRLNFSAANVVSCIPNFSQRSATLILELPMGKRAESWKKIVKLIGDRNDAIADLRNENQQLRQRLSTTESDPADVQADAEIAAFADSIQDDDTKAAADANPVIPDQPAKIS